jgi:hypothetical protein
MDRLAFAKLCQDTSELLATIAAEAMNPKSDDSLGLWLDTVPRVIEPAAKIIAEAGRMIVANEDIGWPQ